jgi:hypothetical protein
MIERFQLVIPRREHAPLRIAAVLDTPALDTPRLIARLSFEHASRSIAAHPTRLGQPRSARVSWL